MSYRLGVLGFGTMGGAIARGLVAGSALAPADIVVADRLETARRRADEAGFAVAGEDASLAGQADCVLVAVKPQDAASAFQQLGPALRGRAVVSIVAGWTTERLLGVVPATTRVLRVMPNTPAQVGAGAYGLSTATTLDEQERASVEAWFRAIGLVEWIDESHLDAVTGLSGGAPAYVAIVIEALADGGVQQGLPRAVAQRLAAQSVLGTARLVLETGIHPADLKDGVCSPGGTTIEGVRALEAAGVRSAFLEAVAAASERARDLG